MSGAVNGVFELYASITVIPHVGIQHSIVQLEYTNKTRMYHGRGFEIYAYLPGTLGYTGFYSFGRPLDLNESRPSHLLPGVDGFV